MTPTSAIVWTRATLSAAATPRSACVSVVYATNPVLSGATETAPIRVDISTDFTARVPLAGLLPNTRYWYATKLAAALQPTGCSTTQFTVGPTGSFVTPPAPGTAAPVRFVVSGDVRANQTALYGIFQQMRAHNPDFFAHLGDLPYADGAPAATNQEEYYIKHANVRVEALLQELLRDVPIVGTWDDHEVENNWDAATNPNKVQWGTTAWRHWFPVPTGAPEIYRTLRWGDALEYFVLDTRSHRGVNGDPDLPGKRMLGAAQMTWLKNALAASSTTFKVIGTSVPLRFGTTGADHWEGYMHERRELLDFIVDNGIENVVFVSADQHWAASYHHREGFRDFQTGPAATTVRTPQSTNDPQQRWVDPVHNYGVIHVDPAAIPPTLTMDWHDGSGARLRREIVKAGPRATLMVTSDVPEARFELGDGPFHVALSGGKSTVQYLEAGNYTARFAELNGVKGIDGRPADLPLSIPPGAIAHVAGDFRDTGSVLHPVLLADGFEGALGGYTIIDEGTVTTPSAWFTDAGLLAQNSNIHDGDLTVAGVPKLGTMAVTGDPAWNDYTMRVRCRSTDDDAFGVVFRYGSPQDYYRFSMDAQRSYRRLVSRKGGAFRVLWSDAGGYSRYDWIDLEIVATGNRIVIAHDGCELLDITDADHGAGRVGLYAWGNMTSFFDDLIVRQGDARPSGGIFADCFEDGVVTGWTIYDQVAGQTSNWFESGGSFNEDSNINDGELSRTGVPKLGTLAIAAAAIGGDYTVRTKLRNSDDDALGVVFRFVDPDNYYRFSMDSQRTYRRLAKVENGVWTALWEDLSGGYRTLAWYDVEVRCAGAEIRVRLDGRLLATVTDAAHAIGGAGLYSWGNSGAMFDNFRVEALRPQRAVLASVGDGTTTTLVGRAPASAGQIYQLVLSTARSPGIPLGLFWPGDPRVVELAPDPLLVATLTASFPGFVGLVGSGGEANGLIPWPPLPAFSGTVLYCGGWVFGSGRIQELWPTVEVVVP